MYQHILERNHVTVHGKGTKPIIFGNGFGCDQTVWHRMLRYFEEDYQIVLFDYVGTGKSDMTAYSLTRYSTLKGYAQDLLDVCHALELKDAVFVGHSVSSMIGVLASIQQPELFSRLVLVGPSPCYENFLPEYYGGFSHEELEGLIDLIDKNYIGWVKMFAPTVMKNDERPALTGELENMFCSTDPYYIRNFAKATFFSDSRKELPLVKTPALVLQCADDAIAPQEVGEYVHRQLSSSTLRLMKATGHCPHMSHPAETVELIQEFLS